MALPFPARPGNPSRGSGPLHFKSSRQSPGLNEVPGLLRPLLFIEPFTNYRGVAIRARMKSFVILAQASSSPQETHNAVREIPLGQRGG